MNRNDGNFPPYEDDEWSEDEEFETEVFVEEEEEEEEYGEQDSDGWYRDFEHVNSLGPYLEHWEAERRYTELD
jgi:hypothetical protein